MRRGGLDINVLRVIDELEHLVESSKGFPLSKHKMVDEDTFFVLTTRLKSALPDDIKKAEQLSRDSDHVVKSANSEAQRLVTDAQQEAQRLVGEARGQAERTIQDSRGRGDRVLEDARREAERIVADAQQHAEQLVAEHTITQRAQQFAAETQQTAMHEAQDLRTQADEYALEIMDKAEAVLHRLINSVEQGKEQIRQTRAQ